MPVHIRPAILLYFMLEEFEAFVREDLIFTLQVLEAVPGKAPAQAVSLPRTMRVLQAWEACGDCKQQRELCDVHSRQLAAGDTALIG